MHTLRAWDVGGGCNIDNVSVSVIVSFESMAAAALLEPSLASSRDDSCQMPQEARTGGGTKRCDRWVS